MHDFLTYGGFIIGTFYAGASGVLVILFHREKARHRRTLMLLDLIMCVTCMYTGFLQGTGLGILRDRLGLAFNWARYLEWAITCPCMLSIISRMSGAPMDNIFISVTFSVIMIACGAAAQAIDDTPFMWVFFAAGILCLGVVFVEIIFNLRRRNATKSSYQKRLNVLIGCTLLSWVLYPSSWTLQFSRAIPVRNEIFLVANVAIKAVFSCILIIDTVRQQAESLRITSRQLSSEQWCKTRPPTSLSLNVAYASAVPSCPPQRSPHMLTHPTLQQDHRHGATRIRELSTPPDSPSLVESVAIERHGKPFLVRQFAVLEDM